ncbi:DNA polymerase Y family protein [Herbaspirillum sp. LeCh32-8]|uniref:Y-family DNA polymerase n=1 Tax=Herbaspirillum sp. LeCh32-8 TaxID=2821356 RepID=UPI001AE5E2FB|nr:DNA polymerase Y family protein [Herbaspirillum sp. LeCh32-8]MBP0597215.1 DNA polymerase Y family protein [Herbaspirillum sp. LeCh32-8]
MSLWIAVHLPLLQLEAFRPNWLAEEPAMMFERDRVSALSASARADGVETGMRRGGARLLSPDAHCHERDRLREAALLDEAALALLQYTPQVSLAEDACVLLDVGASLRLFGGIRALCRRVRVTIARLGLSATLSCAVTATGAWMLARFGYVRTLRAASMRRRLERLPVSLLSAAVPHLEWLHGLGCRRLGQLRRLPRPGLQRRCGKALLEMMDRAYGEAPELHRWVQAPPAFRARMELPDRIDHTDILAAYAQRLLAQLAGWLSARQLAVKQLRLLLEHERGRQAVPPTELVLALSVAAWQEDHLHALLKEKLTRSSLPAPAIALVLVADELEGMQAASQTLFPEPGGSAEDHHRLIELLVARLGPDQVQQAAPQADHRPEVANRWCGVMQDAADLPAPLPADAARLPPRPLWLLADPEPLRLQRHKPFYRTPLELASPPERIEAGWWEGRPVTRDYFTARDARHVYYWIFRQWVGGEQSDQEPQWFLHGLFG